MKKIRISERVKKILIGVSAFIVSGISILVAQKIKASKKVKLLIVGATALISSALAVFFILKKDKKGENK